jgi:excisionase family DNA binding protein
MSRPTPPLSAAEAARQVGVNETTIVRWIRKKLIKGWQPAGERGTWWIERASLEDVGLLPPETPEKPETP